MPEEAGATGKEQTPPDGQQQEPKKDDPPKWVNDLFTRIGRVDAENKKRFEALESRFETMSVSRETSHASPSGGADDLNQKYTERVLQGDFTGAVDDYMAKRRQAEEILNKRNHSKIVEIVSHMEDAPHFKDVKAEVQKIASDFVFNRGYSPEDAVGYAYEKARADHLSKLLAAGGGAATGLDSASLETSGGGSVREDSGAKKGKLNAEGRKAFEKNKAYFKDEGEFIASMSPLVKQRFVG